MRTPTGTTLSPTDDVDDDDNVECGGCCGECDEAEERRRTSRSNCSAVNIRRPPDLAAMESVNDVIVLLAAPLVHEEDGERSSRASTE